MTKPAPSGTSNDTSSSTCLRAERLGDVIEPHRGIGDGTRDAGRRLRSGRHRRRLGKMKKMILTEHARSLTMISIDDRTTARVEARPTPSVPDSVVKPRYDDDRRDDEAEDHRLHGRRDVVGEVDRARTRG